MTPTSLTVAVVLRTGKTIKKARVIERGQNLEKNIYIYIYI